MKKFLVIYGMPKEKFAEWKNMSDEDKQAEGKRWKEWFDKSAEHFHDVGAGVGVNSRLTKQGLETLPNEIGGYSILKAESLEEAKTILSANPHFTGDNNNSSYFDIMELMG